MYNVKVCKYLSYTIEYEFCPKGDTYCISFSPLHFCFPILISLSLSQQPETYLTFGEHSSSKRKQGMGRRKKHVKLKSCRPNRSQDIRNLANWVTFIRKTYGVQSPLQTLRCVLRTVMLVLVVSALSLSMMRVSTNGCSSHLCIF